MVWENLVTLHSDSKRDLKNKPIVLVFTKCDLFSHLEKEMTFGEHISKKIQKYGFNEIPDVEKINEEKLKYGNKLVNDRFEEIFAFFKKQSNNFHVIYTSSFGKENDSNNERFGMEELSELLLPEDTSLSSLLKKISQLKKLFK
jgi:GTPase SAR1 family protein